MRIAALVALLAAFPGGAAFAQAVAPHHQPVGQGTLRGSAATKSDNEAEIARRRSEARLRDREDKARRTLKGICNGC